MTIKSLGSSIDDLNRTFLRSLFFGRLDMCYVDANNLGFFNI